MAIVYDRTIEEQTCTEHGREAFGRMRATVACWLCDGVTVTRCAHGTPAVPELVTHGNGGSHSWRMNNYCVECEAERNAAEAAREAAKAAKVAALAASVTSNERRMFAMFAGRCSVCGGSFPAGADIAYNRAGRSARHIACGATAPGMRRLDCGHTLPVGSVLIMAASTGSACPDCYDRMSN